MAKSIKKIDKLESRMLEVLNKVKLNDIIEYKHESRCPFCSSKDWHFNSKHYLCRDCDANGDAIAYVMASSLDSLEKAVDKLYYKVKSLEQGDHTATP